MSHRLVIGTDTIISTDSGESRLLGDVPDSTVRLWQHPEDTDYFRYSFQNDGAAEVRARIEIVAPAGAGGDDTAQADFETLAAILRGVRSLGVRLEYKSGADRWLMPLRLTELLNVEAQARATGRSITVDCRFYTDALALGGPDQGSPDGAVTPLHFTMTVAAGGIARIHGQVQFENRTTAYTWLDALEAGSNHPTEWGGKFKYYAHEERVDNKPSGHTGSQLVTLEVELRQRIASLIGNAAFDAMRDVRFSIRKHDMQANTERGPSHGYGVSVSGYLQFKTETLTTLRPGQVAPSPANNWEQLAQTAIDAILADAGNRVRLDLHELERTVDPDVGDGFVDFDVTCIALGEGDDEDFSWSETVFLRYDANAEQAQRSDGSTKVFPGPSGMNVILEHTLDIKSLRKPRYSVPEIAGPASRWYPMHGGMNLPEAEVALHRSGVRIWTLKAVTNWIRQSSGQGDAVRPPTMSSGMRVENLL